MVWASIAGPGAWAATDAQRAHIPGMGPRDTVGSVVRLTESTLGRVLGSGDAWFIKFYSPNCGHCRHMAPAWEALAAAVAEAGLTVRVGEVDASRAKAAAKRHGVSGFPTLLYFGEDGRARKAYRGPRTAEALLAYVERLGRPAVTEAVGAGDMAEFLGRHAGTEADAAFVYLAGDGEAGAGDSEILRGSRRVFDGVAASFREELSFAAAGAERGAAREVAAWLGDAVDAAKLPAVVAVHRLGGKGAGEEGTCAPGAGVETCGLPESEGGMVEGAAVHVISVTQVLYPLEVAPDARGARNVGKAMRDFVHVGRFVPLLQLSQATFGPLTRSETRGRRILVVILADDGTGEHSRQFLAELEDVGKRVHETLQVAWLPVDGFPAWQARFMGPKGANRRPYAFVYDYARHKFYMDPDSGDYTTGVDVERLASGVLAGRLRPYMAWERGLAPYDYVIFLTSYELLSAAVLRDPGFALFCVTGPTAFLFLIFSFGCCRGPRRPKGTPDLYTVKSNLAVKIEARKREAVIQAKLEKRRARDRKIRELTEEIDAARRKEAGSSEGGLADTTTGAGLASAAVAAGKKQE